MFVTETIVGYSGTSGVLATIALTESDQSLSPILFIAQYQTQ